MAVVIGSARIGENGSVKYGKSGDQTGNEVSTQEWYKHSKGWKVLRPKRDEDAEKLSFAMNAACKNDNIGYSQTTRYEAYDWCKRHGTFNPAEITGKVNTDCSALVRLCLAYAGIFVDDFSTYNEFNIIMDTGRFIDASGTASVNPDYLKAGDILVTKSKGHTVIVLTDGKKFAGKENKSNQVRLEVEGMAVTYMFRTIEIKDGKGMEGGDVLLVQEILNARGYKGKDGKPLVLDGDTGSDYEKSNTMYAIKTYIEERNAEGANLGDPTGWGPRCWGDQNFIKVGE